MPSQPDSGSFPPRLTDEWAVFVFATMVYDANHARMHAMVESCIQMGFEAAYVEFPSSRSPYHPYHGAPTLNDGGLRLAPPDRQVIAPEGSGVLCVPKKVRVGPFRIPLGRRLQEELQGAWLKEFFARYRARTGNRILAIVSTARWEPLLRDVPFDRLVFDKLDPPEVLKGWLSRDEYVQREDALIARSALTLAITEALDADIQARHPNARTLLVPNGVEVAYFDRHAQDAVPELDGAPRPVVGFLGTVADWVDIPLFVSCAKQYPSWTFAMFGPVNSDVDLSPVEGIPNIRRFGRVPYDRVPAIMNAFDVAVMPFLPGAFSSYANPVTLFEFLALGKPVVCTPLSDMADLEPVLYMADEQFVDNVGRAARENDPAARDRRRTAALEHDWSRLMHAVITNLFGEAWRTG